MYPLGTVETWHEISRPQIHGYDLIAATFLGSMRFASVADEKVARVFDAPKGYIKTLNSLGITNDAGEIVSVADFLPHADRKSIFRAHGPPPP